MWRFVDGYCPVHNKNIKILIEYNKMCVVGGPAQYKGGAFKCDESIDTEPVCSNCPIFIQNIRNFPK